MKLSAYASFNVVSVLIDVHDAEIMATIAEIRSSLADCSLNDIADMVWLFFKNYLVEEHELVS